jgi:nitrogen fixation NifU-like protein
MSGLDDLYQQIILDHAKARHGEGALPADDAHAERFERNPTCGDEVRLRITIDGELVQRVGWEGQGCSISQASASILGQDVPGLTRAAAQDRVDAMRRMLRTRGEHDEADLELLADASSFEGVAKFPMRVKCAMLPWVALEDTLRQVTARD